MLNMLTSLGIRLLFWSMRILPIRLVGAIGAGIGRTAYHCLKKHRNIALNNLQRIYPNKKIIWHTNIAKESFAELGRSMLELPHVFLRSKDFLLSRVTIEGEEEFRKAMQEGKGVFITACHFSNWELSGLLLSILGYKTSMIYRPIKQPALETYLKEFREALGCTMHSRMDGIRWLPKTLKNGECVTIVIDQHMSQGIQVPFLGHLSNTTALPATFIARNNTPTFGLALERIGKGFHFHLKFWRIEPPVLTQKKEQDQKNIMHTICKSFDSIIHTHPEQWLWLHRRWLILDEGFIQDSKVKYGAS